MHQRTSSLTGKLIRVCFVIHSGQIDMKRISVTYIHIGFICYIVLDFESEMVKVEVIISQLTLVFSLNSALSINTEISYYVI